MTSVKVKFVPCGYSEVAYLTCPHCGQLQGITKSVYYEKNQTDCFKCKRILIWRVNNKSGEECN